MFSAFLFFRHQAHSAFSGQNIFALSETGQWALKLVLKPPPAKKSLTAIHPPSSVLFTNSGSVMETSIAEEGPGGPIPMQSGLNVEGKLAMHSRQGVSVSHIKLRTPK